MTFEEELTEMPWKMIGRYHLGTNSLVIIFRSGIFMEARPPKDKQLNQLKDKQE